MKFSDELRQKKAALQNELSTLLQDTGEVPFELPYYTLTKPLDNGTYTLRLTVKNQYGIYSPEASKALTVSYVLPQKPTVYCSGNDENGTISRCGCELPYISG